MKHPFIAWSGKAFVCILCLLPWSAQAGQTGTRLLGIDPRGLYVGGSFTYGFGDFEEQWSGSYEQAENLLRAAGLPVAISVNNADDAKIGYRLYGGYRFNRYIGIEGGYMDLGKYSFSSTIECIGTPCPGQIPGPTPLSLQTEPRLDLSVDSLFYSLMLHYPIGKSLDPYVRIGGASWDASVTTNTLIFNGSPNLATTDLLFGVGLDFRWSDRLAGRAEWQRVFVSIDNIPDINIVDVGLRYSFGR